MACPSCGFTFKDLLSFPQLVDQTGTCKALWADQSGENEGKICGVLATHHLKKKRKENHPKPIEQSISLLLNEFVLFCFVDP
jgi:hypothetical protein